MRRRAFLGLGVIVPVLAACGGGSDAKNSAATKGFALWPSEGRFTLDGRPFQMRSGELHPARIPREYWSHRIRMVKAMGLNTVALYVMWNHHEREEGQLDFTRADCDIPAFVRLCQEEGMYVLLRPGPYVCAEWDLGGLPPYLLKDYPDHEALRRNASVSPHYFAACRRYIDTLAPLVAPLMLDNGGPILMIQVENEFASWDDGPDPRYLADLEAAWRANGISGPFCYEDGLGQAAGAHGNPFPSGSAFGISAGDADAISYARSHFPNVVPYAGEIWVGWFTHWGDAAMALPPDHSGRLAALMANEMSFNLYVVHGGTSFGLAAGANAGDSGADYEPDVTSYDYAAPVSEDGLPTPSYNAYRKLIGDRLGGVDKLPAVPDAPPRLDIASLPAITTVHHASLHRLALGGAAQGAPRTMESLGQAQGLVRYRTRLSGDPRGGRLQLGKVHDYALVLIDGQYIGALSRSMVPSAFATQYGVVTGADALPIPASLTLDTSAADHELEVLVEAMGHIGFNTGMNSDAKGLLGPCSFVDAAGSTIALADWQSAGLPLADDSFQDLAPDTVLPLPAGGQLFTGSFALTTTGDVYLDMRDWAKGMLWVNGHLLGRYWSIGPQFALFCPGVWLKSGTNTVQVLDLHHDNAESIRFAAGLRGH